MHQHMKSFVSRTEKVEESFLDKLDIAGRQNFSLIDTKDKSGRSGKLPQQINLPDLPLVRVQDRRFDSSASSLESQPTTRDKQNTFERRRRTHNHTTNPTNDATD